MKKNKGFTLIELLVVIAIIGILASIVLASLSNARDKGKDASVKSQLSSMRAQAELYFTNNGSYYTDDDNNVCIASLANNGFGGASVDNVTKKITLGPGLLFATQEASAIPTPEAYLNLDGAWDQITCQARAADPDTGIIEAWVVEAPMSDSKVASGGTANENAKMYCVDSLGTSKEMDKGDVLAAGDYKCE